MDVKEIFEWAPESRLKSAEGLIKADVAFEGRLNDLKAGSLLRTWKPLGKFNFRM